VKVNKFLDKKQYTEVEDLTLQAELYAYIVASHYSISLQDVYNMPLPIFQQSLKWALAVKEQRDKKMEVNKQKSKAGDREVVSLDYSFLDWE
tara:strand:- start:685 stop:960 length:276 start_codon:yes stop_codon:yes gene_type:complete